MFKVRSDLDLDVIIGVEGRATTRLDPSVENDGATELVEGSSRISAMIGHNRGYLTSYYLSRAQ